MLIHFHTVYGSFPTTVKNCIFVKETVWPANPKILTIWTFIEKVCLFLVKLVSLIETSWIMISASYSVYWNYVVLVEELPSLSSYCSPHNRPMN